MNKFFLITFLLLISFFQSYSQEQTPAVEWVEHYAAGNRGGSITAFPGPGILFALIKGQNSISGTASISKFHPDGLVKNQFIHSEGGSSNAPVMSQYASQDGGVLVYIPLGGILRKYDSGLNSSWQKNITYTIQNATATLAYGYYILSTRVVSSSTVSELRRIASDGTEEWSVDVTGFAGSPADIQTSSDDGVIIATAAGVKKYSTSGQLVWTNSSITGGYQLAPSDAASMYVLSSNAGSSTISSLSSATGSTNWSRIMNNESIYDFKRTVDNGCVFSTSGGIYKFNSAGTQQWKNTDYTNAKLATSIDAKIFALKNNTIFKMTLDNGLLWSKAFNNNYYLIREINSAEDYGLYVTAVKSGNTFNTSPDYLLFKLASSGNPCKTNFDITGSDATVCYTTNPEMTVSFGSFTAEYRRYLSDFSLQWYKNDQAIEAATGETYKATTSGSYSLRVKQNGCETPSRQVAINLLNGTAPEIRGSKDTICPAVSVILTAQGCEGTVVWSTGATDQSITVTPIATTTYNAFCEQTINNAICRSPASNYFTITVINSSGLKVNSVSGRKEFCEQSSTELQPVISGGRAPYSFAWGRNNADISYSQNLLVNEEGKYLLNVFDSFGCNAKSDSVMVRKILNPATPVITQPANPVICTGGSITLTTNTKENIYQWYLNETEIAGAFNQFYNAVAPGNYQLKITNAYNCPSQISASVSISASNLRIDEITGSREFCEHTTTQLNGVVSGGIAPLNYQWSKNSSGVSNSANLTVSEDGKYLLSVSDKAGCNVKSDTVTIRKLAAPATPLIDQPSKTIVCKGGEVVLKTSMVGKTYQWYLNNNEIAGAINQSYNVTLGGSYHLKITNAENCASLASAPLLISVSNLKVEKITGKTEFCENTTTQLTGNATGGVTPLVYSWSRNSNIVSTTAGLTTGEEGKYLLTIVDNIGCKISSDTVAVKKLALPAAPVITTTAARICAGENAVLTTGTKENSYQWLLNNTAIGGSNSQTYTATGSGKYSLKVTNANGCSAMSENTITIEQIIIVQPTISQSNDTLVSSAANGNKWYLNGTELPSTTQRIRFTEVGNYQVKVFDKGCSSTISAVFIPILLASEQDAPQLLVYPNPATDKVIVKSAQVFQFKLIDISGRMLRQSAAKQQMHTIMLRDLAPGDYLIITEEENGRRLVKKLVVNQ